MPGSTGVPNNNFHDHGMLGPSTPPQTDGSIETEPQKSTSKINTRLWNNILKLRLRKTMQSTYT